MFLHPPTLSIPSDFFIFLLFRDIWLSRCALWEALRGETFDGEAKFKCRRRNRHHPLTFVCQINHNISIRKTPFQGFRNRHHPLSFVCQRNHNKVSFSNIQISQYWICHHPLTFVCEPVKEIAIRSFSFHKYSQYISEKRPMSRF